MEPISLTFVFEALSQHVGQMDETLCVGDALEQAHGVSRTRERNTARHCQRMQVASARLEQGAAVGPAVYLFCQHRSPPTEASASEVADVFPHTMLKERQNKEMMKDKGAWNPRGCFVRCVTL